jgi:ankyrin repeat protein
MDEIFDFINKQEFDKLKEYILKNKDIDYDIKDKSDNYLIHYLVLNNQVEIIELLLESNIRLDMLDIDGRTILYIPIKFNYYKLVKLIVEYNKKIIGISILDIQDNLGYTALTYAILSNNLDIIEILFKNGASVNIRDLEFALSNNKTDILIFLINQLQNRNNFDINLLTNTNESFFQLAIYYQNNIIINILLTKNININNQESEYGLTALHQSIISNNLELTKKLLDHNADVNLQDYYGNNALFYAIIENNIDIILLLLKYNIKYNISNIEGNTILHLFLENNKGINNNEILFKKLIENTDLNIQNNKGDTCLHYIVVYDLFLNFKDILENKELNIFIKNVQNISCFNLLFDASPRCNSAQDIIINSYYNVLKNKKNKLLLDWEYECGTGNKSEKFCKTKIKEIIFKEYRSIPKFRDDIIILDNNPFVNTCFYTGSTLDILCGILYLYKVFKNLKMNIIIDYPLTINLNLQNYYKHLGINYNYKIDFCNFEIIWSYQKIFFPTYFDDIIKKNLKLNKYIIIPLGIEVSNGSHANILFWNIENKLLERFEPNGANEPIGLNYNYELLDQLIYEKFKSFDNKIKYLKPIDYLPTIGFQILENKNETKCDRIGDPNGFCGVWCIWWIHQKLKNIKIDSKKLAFKLIKEIKLNNLNFKTLIRNFSNKIIDIRDLFLNKFKLDINDWINENYDTEIVSQLEKNIITYYQQL